MNQQSSSPIDLEQLHQISEGDIEFEIEVLQAYAEDIHQRINLVSEAIANHDHEQIMRATHHIKGASSNVGAWQMQALAVQLDNLERSQNLANIPKILDSMIKEMQSIDQFIIARIL